MKCPRKAAQALSAVSAVAGFWLCVPVPAASGGVVINEFQAAPNELLLARTPEGMTRTGWLPAWQDADFPENGWQTGRAPLGHSYAAGQLGTDLTGVMRGRTPTMHARKTFTLTAEEAARTEDLLVRVRYDDGFVLWINGREVTRANLGPPGQHVFHRQVTYRAGIAQTPPPVPAELDFNAGPASGWLKAGQNVVAVTVSNRHPGTGTDAGYNNACLVDLSVSVIPALVQARVAGADFAESDGASRTFRRAGAGLETVTGTPPAGSWLALAPPPVIPASHPGLTVRAVAAADEGAAGPGAMRWEVSQAVSGPQSAEFSGAALPLEARWPGNLTAPELERLTFRFRWRAAVAGTGAAAGNALFGFRLEGPGGVALTGFPEMGTAGLTDPAPNEFANGFGGSRRLTVDAQGTAVTSSSGLLRGNPLLSCGPAMRGGVFRVTEDVTAGAGYGGTAGVLKVEMTQAPAAADEVRLSYPGLAVPAFADGRISAEDFVNQGWTVAVRAPAGRTVRLFLTPDDSTVAAQAGSMDYGMVTGTGAWQVLRFSFGAGTGAETVRMAMNAAGVTGFRTGVAMSSSLPAGQAVYVDRPGPVTQWRLYEASFAAVPESQRMALLAALNAAAVKTITPVFTKLSHPVSPVQHTLTVDDAALEFRVSGGVREYHVSEAADGWRYFPGHCEPSGGLADPAWFGQPGYDGDWSDWIELHNPGAAPVSMTGWRLSDSLGAADKWTFPGGTVIAPGGYLLVLASGEKAPPPGARYVHGDFKLGSGGGDVVLSDPFGNLMSVVRDYPLQDGFHTWARAADGTYGYSATGTPGAANLAPALLPERCAAPEFSLPAGYHAGALTLALTTATPGAEIRYTLDGTDPVEDSLLYTSPLSLGYAGNGRGHCVRARAFLAGRHHSEIRTRTYLIGQNALMRSAPAVCLSGDEGRTFFKPHGIAAIQGGSRPGALWQADTVTDYNNALGDLNNPLETGQPWERPVTFEFLPGTGGTAFNEDLGIRISGSPFSRPRYELDNIATLPWSYTNLFEKPSFNLWWRGEYGNDRLEYPVFGDAYPVSSFRHLRLRGGHNDMPNPYVKDELVRRLFIAMGREGSRGTFNPLFVNGKFAGIYNLCERVREPFMQAHFGGNQEWDVIQRGEIASGDGGAFADMLAKIDAHAVQPTAVNYAAVEERIDTDALIDYLLLYTWAGTGDWPHNNWIASRERVPGGKWRWFPWDAEGAFGGFSKTLGYNILVNDLRMDIRGTNRELCRVYSSLILNREFRLRFADRVNRHLCNGGALTDARLAEERNRVVAEYQPLLSYILTSTVNVNFFNEWVNATATDKRDVLFRSAVLTVSGVTGDHGYQLARENVWPSTNGRGTWMAPLPPLLSRQGGTAGPDFLLEMRHTVPADDRAVDNPYQPAADQQPKQAVIYYTLDGSDPRLRGGAVSPSAILYAGGVGLPQRQVTVKARVLHHDVPQDRREWSPLTEAEFQPETVPPAAENLAVAEIMYHPPAVTALEPGFTDREDFEFVRLVNTGTQPVNLGQARFTEGIEFSFSSGSIRLLDPGDSVVIVSDREAFRLRYGAAAAARVAGEYGGQLGNGGEWLRLEDTQGQVIHRFAYDDVFPWPEPADGGGPSLVLKHPESLPDPAVAMNWTLSAMPGGLGGAVPGVPVTYARWQAYQWPAGAAGSAAGEDPDGDGLTNFLEFVLGLDPMRPEAPDLRSGLMEESGGHYLYLETDILPVTGVALTAEAGSGGAWRSGEPAVLPAGTPVPLPDGRVRHRWRDAVPVEQASRRFMRLRVAVP